MYFNHVYSTILFPTSPISALLARPYPLFIFYFIYIALSQICASHLLADLRTFPEVWLTYQRSHTLKEILFLPTFTLTHHPSTF